MLLLAAFILGLVTDLWWVPLFAGPIGQIAHFASSRTYRSQLAIGGGARAAALLSTLILSALAFGAYNAARLLVQAFGGS